MRTHSGHTRGFTLVELAITILIMGLVIGFSIPAFQAINASNELKGAAAQIAGELRLGREKAMGGGHNQLYHFWVAGNAWHVHDMTTFAVYGPIPLPKHVILVQDANFTLQKDGRADFSADIILRDLRGNRDTVSVLTSGTVISH